MGAGEAYLQGGATLVLVVLAAAVIVWLATENRTLKKDNKELIEASIEALNKYRERDQEELRSWRDDQRRKSEARRT